MTPAELDAARELAARMGGDLRDMDFTALISRVACMTVLLPKLLAHADLLAAENELLQAFVNEAAAEGPSAAMLIQAAAEERQACCEAACWRCREGVPVEHRYGRGWLHPDAPGAPDGYGCEAGEIRARGPCRPPLPVRLREENERLRVEVVAAAGVMAAYAREYSDPGLLGASDRARAALEAHAGE